MTLITSISGIRGTIGGKPQDNLTPVDIIAFSAAYGEILREQNPNSSSISVVVGRDARMSGEALFGLVSNTLILQGIDVIDLGVTTTPTTEMAVPFHGAQGGIILTASHNPKQWNALKLLDSSGEFISSHTGQRVLDLAREQSFSFAEVDNLGRLSKDPNALQRHIDAIFSLPIVKQSTWRKDLKVVVDGINSSGADSIPMLLRRMGIEQIIVLNAEMHGDFAHNPEPLETHLQETITAMKTSNADLGIVVDPDVDRLAFISEDGSMFGEEYTIVAIAEYILQKEKGATVSNLSSTKALRDVTEAAGGKYFASAVGEVNVVHAMKQHQAVFGGEGNGGVIYPPLHYGRDALVGVALFLAGLGDRKASEWRKSLPQYAMAKEKVTLKDFSSAERLLTAIQLQAPEECTINTVDGVKIEYTDRWVHLRKSNTEAILRVYSEAPTIDEAQELALSYVKQLEALVLLDS